VTPAAALVANLRSRGVTLEPRGDKLRVVPASAVTPEEVDALRQHKAEVLALLAPARSLAVDPETVREVLGPHPDLHDLAILELDVLTVVRRLEQEIATGTITSGLRLIRGRPLGDWLGMTQLARLMGTLDTRMRRRA
jgi:TubC N-terminal docking domain